MVHTIFVDYPDTDLKACVNILAMVWLAQLLKIKPITMHHQTIEYILDAGSNPNMNIICLHAILSSSSTAFSIPFFIEPLAKGLQAELNYNLRFHLLDARNHGLSPHSDIFCLPSMAVDLNEFIYQNSLSRTISSDPLLILGHSMGSKVGLLYSLLCGEDISGIISLDASPSTYYHNHQRIFDAMKAVDFSRVHKNYDADQQLKEHGIMDASERGFILDNLKNLNNNQWEWKCNLDVISENEQNVHGFPDLRYMSIYHGHSLFIGGTVGSDRLTNPHYCTLSLNLEKLLRAL